MSLSSISLKRPVLATVMAIVIVLFGCIGYTRLGVRDYPAIDPPVITVRTSYTGASPGVIESQITVPLEQAINGVQGIRDISSTSALGSSNISVEFNIGCNLETAANDMRDAVSKAIKKLPQNIDAPPVVTKEDANAGSILALTVKSSDKNNLQVTDYAENVIENVLETIPGVSSIQVWGEQKYAMRIWMDPAKLASYNLTPLDVANALAAQNVNLPAGSIEGNTTQLMVNTNGTLVTENDFNNLVIKSNGTQTIRVKDIGYAQLGPQNLETILKESGTPMVGLGVVPQPGANYVQIAQDFYTRLAQLKKSIPKDYQLNVALDTTKSIKASISEVKITLLIAFILVILIIYLFFRDTLIALRPLIDIPVSLIGAFFIMYVAGLSVNILTLLGIVLATGLVVDDGIVVTENIYKKIEAGMSPMQAAIKGCEEIFFAVVATSLTLAVVFLPIMFLQGFTGQLFREFAIVVAGAVLISAFVSLSLTPVLNVKLARRNHKRSKFYERTEPFFVGMNNWYSNAMHAFMQRRWLSFVIIAVCVGIIFFLGASLPRELAPLEDKSLLRVITTGPEGASYNFTNTYMDSVTSLIEADVPEKTVCLTVTSPSFTGSGALNTGYTRLVLVPPNKRKRTQNQIAHALAKALKRLPSARSIIIQEQTIAVGSGKFGQPVQFVVEAPTLAVLRKVIPDFMDTVERDPVFRSPDINLKFNNPQLNLPIDRNKASALGVSVNDIEQTIEAALSGERLGYFYKGNYQYEIIGQFENSDRAKPLDIKSMYVRSSNGNMVQLDNLLQVSDTSLPAQLYHYNRFESATISASTAPGKTLGDGINEMYKLAKTINPKTHQAFLPGSVTTELAGASRDFEESSSDIVFALILGLVLIYLILAAQFESFIDPFIIMLTVPLAMAGALLSLWYLNQTLNIFSEIGIITLIGLVTKNSILIVEFANQLQEKEGLSVREAAIKAAISRFRPILMTTLAMALGALPIALADTSHQSLGTVIVGGLIFALVFTLFVIPAIYTYLARPYKKQEDAA